MRPMTISWVLAVLCAAGIGSAQAQAPTAARNPQAIEQRSTLIPKTKPAIGEPSALTTPAVPRAIDAADLSAYVDGLVDAGMQSEGIAGVTVAVVDRQGPLLLRGYGIAEQEPRRPVTPDRTLFRIASISKTFTYLLGLKLVDSGRLKLDAPVNEYLPAALKLPDDGFKPVLVRHLFTHTAGYEDSVMGHLFHDRAADVTTLNTYLLNHRPKRVREPGVHAVYSNYSVALLGAIVARIDGVDFETLAERRLFAPMGMMLTTFREPLLAGDPRRVGPQFEGLWSQGYERSGGGFKPQKFEFIAQVAPAGGASSDAADMARYLRMMINGGTLDGVAVLSPSEFARLQGEPLFRNAPNGTGFSYGFFKRRYGQVDSLEHGGATNWFHSNFVAVPALGVGIFVSTNTGTGRKFAAELPEKILARYFAQARPAPLPAKLEKFDSARFLGDYFSERSNYTSAEKLLLNTPATIALGPDGLTLRANGESSLWLPEGGLRFREAEGDGHMTFIAENSGAIVGFANAGGHNVYARAGFFDQTLSLQIALGLALACSILVLVGAWRGRNRKLRDHKHRDSPAVRRATLWLRSAAGIWLVFIAIFAYAMIKIVGDTTEAFYRFPGLWLTVALWLSPLAMIMSLICLLRLPAAWGAREWTWWRKSKHTFVVATYVFACWTLWVWNLVVWKL